jgi:hypothetical protein
MRSHALQVPLLLAIASPLRLFGHEVTECDTTSIGPSEDSHGAALSAAARRGDGTQRLTKPQRGNRLNHGGIAVCR